MEVSNFKIEGPLLIKAKSYFDERGEFYESYREELFHKIIGKELIQENVSISKKGVLRGIHYQIEIPQGKLVSVANGSILDIAVDLRKNSKTLGSSIRVELSGKDNYFFWIPEGFGHAFLALEDETKLIYKCSNYYHPEFDRTIRFDDEDLNLDWPKTDNLILSEKDKAGEYFRNAELL